MNQRTAKLIHKYAREKRVSVKSLKRAWNKIPRPDRHAARVHLLQQL